MKKGFKLIDGTIWTIISYDVTNEYNNSLDKDTPLSAITSVTGVKWQKGDDCTHPFKACFSDCSFETFKTTDKQLVCVVNDVFELINLTDEYDV